MDFNFSAFQEPRGVMRVLHFVFSICAFATIANYNGDIKFNCVSVSVTKSMEFSYPFNDVYTENISKDCSISVTMDFSSDAQFFVATGVLSMLYSIAIIFVYIKMDESYKTNKKLPLYDFLVTVFLAVLWLSSSAAWANGLTGLKTVTGSPQIDKAGCCTSSTSSYSPLNISVIFGFLNFFLWAADLWFLYKETEWFQGNQPQTTSGV